MPIDNPRPLQNHPKPRGKRSTDLRIGGKTIGKPVRRPALRFCRGLNPYLACALAAGAKFSASRDDDLLALEKPFGIQIVTPRDLLAKLIRMV
ncbi:MAG: hypothetical protein HZA89_08215 [Verrucomicrobia bacterium]|nr:hypothetical protein [Verrucomicrobiota bacterium]